MTETRNFWEINIGHLITIVIFFIGMVGAYVKSSREVQEMKTKLDIIYCWFEGEVLTNGNHNNPKRRAHSAGSGD